MALQFLMSLFCARFITIWYNIHEVLQYVFVDISRKLSQLTKEKLSYHNAGSLLG